jgi:hypothetical protein
MKIEKDFNPDEHRVKKPSDFWACLHLHLDCLHRDWLHRGCLDHHLQKK